MIKCQITVGKDLTTGLIRVDCKESYFLSELLTISDKNLHSAKTFDFKVHTVSYGSNHSNSLNSGCAKSDSTEEIAKDCNQLPALSEPLYAKSKRPRSNGDEVEEYTKLDYVSDEEQYLLDIDLDFFSTQNPFKDVYSERQYELLKRLYKFTRPVDDSDEALAVCNQKRSEQLSALKSVFQMVQDGRNLEEITDINEDLIELIRDLKKTREDPIDWLWVHEAGCTCDDTELPHHISSSEQIATLVKRVKTMLSQLPKPLMITVARSSDDDYCPKDQVEEIQSQVLAMLGDIYGQVEVVKHYELT